MLSKRFAFTCHHPQLAALTYIAISTTAFSAMNTAIRSLGDELDATVIVTLRNFITLLLLLPWLLRHGTKALHTKRIKSHAWRGLVGGVGMITWTYSLTVMPLTHATALSFVAPLFSTLFAILFLGEKGGTARWLALFAGFIGTLIILRPDAGGFDSNAFIVIFATMCWATTGMFVKSLSATEPPMRMVFYMNLFMLLMATPLGLIHWQTPSLQAWLTMILIASCSIVMHFLMVKAYALAPVTTLMPFDFTRLVSTAIFAYLIFGETSDWHTWLGAAIIVASAVFMARRDVRHAKTVVVE